MEQILENIKQKKKFRRVALACISLLISALVYNIFLLPLNIVTGGTGGIATITKYIYHIEPSLMILILSLACIIISIMHLGFEKTTGAFIATFLYPLLVDITAPLAKALPLDTSDTFIIIIFASVLSGLASGMMYKTGYNSGGLTVISHILYEKFKIAISNSSLIINALVILLGGYFFGSINAMYAMIYLYISNIVMNKVLLGISNNKAFYIITSEEDMIKQYIIERLHHNVTSFDVKGGFLEKKRKVLLTVIPSREYYRVTEGIKMLDKDAFFVATDSYEVIGGK